MDFKVIYACVSRNLQLSKHHAEKFPQEPSADEYSCFCLLTTACTQPCYILVHSVTLFNTKRNEGSDKNGIFRDRRGAMSACVVTLTSASRHITFPNKLIRKNIPSVITLYCPHPLPVEILCKGRHAYLDDNFSAFSCVLSSIY